MIITSVCKAGIEELIDGGMDIARINLAHMNSQEEGKVLYDSLKTAFRNKGVSRPIYVDIRGPSIRLSRFPDNKSIELLEGKEIYITTNRHVSTSSNIIFCDFPSLADHLKVGDKITVDYGKALLTVHRILKESDVLPNLSTSSPIHVVYPVSTLPAPLINRSSGP